MKEKLVFVVKSSESPRKKAKVEETEAVVARDGSRKNEDDGGFESLEECRECVVNLKEKGADAMSKLNLKTEDMKGGDIKWAFFNQGNSAETNAIAKAQAFLETTGFSNYLDI